MTIYTYHTDGAAFFRRPATTMTAREFAGKKSEYSRPAERADLSEEDLSEEDLSEEDRSEAVSFGEMLEFLGRSRDLIESLDNVVERRPRRLQGRP